MYEMMTQRIWKFGKPAELWARNESFIETFIGKNKLKPVSDAYLDLISAVGGGIIIDGNTLGEFMVNTALKSASASKSSSRQTVGKFPIRWPFPFPGGIRGPHFHFQDKIYLLNKKQWGDFSGRIMKDIQSRIAKTNSVSFDQLVELSEATGGMV